MIVIADIDIGLNFFWIDPRLFMYYTTFVQIFKMAATCDQQPMVHCISRDPHAGWSPISEKEGDLLGFDR